MSANSPDKIIYQLLRKFSDRGFCMSVFFRTDKIRYKTETTCVKVTGYCLLDEDKVSLNQLQVRGV